MTNGQKRVVDALRASGKRGANTIQLVHACGPRFGARICELRNMGYEIEREVVGVPKRIHGSGQIHVYKLVSSPHFSG